MKDKLSFLLPQFTSKKTYILFFLPIIIYLSTASFDYALDDGLYITSNDFTKKGFSGIVDHLTNEALTGFYGEQKDLLTGGRYRPLAPITYTIEYGIYGFKPGMSHLINAILYGFLILNLFNLFNRYKTFKQSENILFFGLLLFASHPLHAEVVANIKGRDQLMAMLFCIGSTNYTFQYIEGKSKALIGALVLFFLALLSKESAITLLPIIPLSLYYFNESKLKAIMVPTIGLVTVSVVWFVSRAAVIQGFQSIDATTVLNDPFLLASSEQRYATLFYVFLIAAKLLVFPYPLTHDYFPFHLELQTWNSPFVWAGILIVLALTIGTIYGISKKKAFAFWLIFLAATYSISSNVVFNIGSFFNERFLFEASLASSILMAGLLYKFIPKQSKNISIGLITVFSILSVSRSFAWKDNFTLFTTDVKTSENSVKVLMAAGGSLLDGSRTLQNPKQKIEQLNQSIQYLVKATDLLPTEINAYRLLGNAYYERDGITMEFVNAYKAAFEIIPQDPILAGNVQSILANTNKPVDKRLAFGIAFQEEFESNAAFQFRLGLIYAQEKGNLKKGIELFQNAHDLDPQNLEYLNKIALVKGMSGDFVASIKAFEQVLEIDPFNKEALMGASTGYVKIGNQSKADELNARIR